MSQAGSAKRSPGKNEVRARLSWRRSWSRTSRWVRPGVAFGAGWIAAAANAGAALVSLVIAETRSLGPMTSRLLSDLDLFQIGLLPSVVLPSVGTAVDALSNRRSGARIFAGAHWTVRT